MVKLTREFWKSRKKSNQMFEVTDEKKPQNFKFLKVPQYKLLSMEGKLKLSVELQSVQNMGDVDLQICPYSVVILTKEEKLRLDLPNKIEEKKSVAKWIRKKNTLIIEMPIINKLD
eukprot:TRINITY_DN10413_c1_g3_i3.p5 TRINITY_DN10413_c1_g3~~TRINITY_DN10413_c1_g3_i3.p5  ORF type:complete len:116 (-),score=18.05 TRINITY_DN10413_c1_g3_i3:600-947(-)